MILDQICIDGKVTNNERQSFSILEIGCGTSTLVRDLKRYIEERHPMIDVHACGTDVSKICIDINTKRDCSDIQTNIVIDENINGLDKQIQPRGSLWYEVLNALDGEPSQRNWDLIIDKGCLDTFLFRSRSRGSRNKNYPECLRILLDNVHGWQGSREAAGDAASTDNDEQPTTTKTSQADGNNTVDDIIETSKRKESLRKTGSVYLCMTPRPKLKAVRDYAGFCSVKRCTLPKNCQSTLESKNYVAKKIEGAIEGRSGDGVKVRKKSDSSLGYMYVCTRNDDYQVGITMPFPSN